MKDKNLGFRLAIILLVIGVCVWSLRYSVEFHSLEGDAKEQYRKDNPKNVAQAVNFGLDLAGGTHIVLELDSTGLTEEKLRDAQEQTLEIIRNRVDKFGVSEPVIAASGINRIVVDLAGVPAAEARSIVGNTAKLEFRMLTEYEQFANVFPRIQQFVDNKVAQVVAPTTEGAEGDLSNPAAATPSTDIIDESTEDILGQAAPQADPAKTAELPEGSVAATTVADKDPSLDALPAVYRPFAKKPFAEHFLPQGGTFAIVEDDIEAVKALFEEPAIQNLIPPSMSMAWGYGFETLEGQVKAKLFYPVKTRKEMGGKYVTDAKHMRTAEGIVVDLTLGGLGPKRFYTITKNNVGKRMAIVLDGQVVSAPNINGAISGGRASITGMADLKEAKQLAVILKAGALPVKSEIVELREVGASLGVENVNSGLFAGAVGLALVIGFMVVYYMGAGINAVIALIINMIILGAIMSMFHATLTLPGIAGIILTIGMAVDANVIIFERIREELRSGKSSRMAIHNGYAKAFTSIIDANVTTFLTAFILFQIGSGPIKGFGLTLMIGIAASLFTALYLTRFIFDVFAKDSDTAKMSIGGGLPILNNPKFDVIGKSKGFIILSSALVVISLGLVFGKGLNYSIDFKGGNIITVDVEGEANPQTIEQALKAGGLSVGSVKSISSATGDKQHIMISISADEKVDAQTKASADTREEVMAALSKSNIKAEIISEDLVGPSIGKDLKNDAMKAVFWSLLIILAYIRLRFGKNGFGFGLGSIVALAHDVIITLGIFAALGFQVDAAIIAAILTIVGYSLNDTIVVFDRIRENTELMGTDSYANKVNASVNQSFSRTFITSLTTGIVVVILALFGGIAIKEFAVAMTIGVVVGTYSSVFIASPFVIWWSSKRPV